MRRRRSFTAEFKADAVALVIVEGRPIVDVARSLGIGEGTLGNWVRQDRIDRIDRIDKAGVTTSERDELSELRRENTRLRMERDLLKRATAFWVKESELAAPIGGPGWRVLLCVSDTSGRLSGLLSGSNERTYSEVVATGCGWLRASISENGSPVVRVGHLVGVLPGRSGR